MIPNSGGASAPVTEATMNRAPSRVGSPVMTGANVPSSRVAPTETLALEVVIWTALTEPSGLSRRISDCLRHHPQ